MLKFIIFYFFVLIVKNQEETPIQNKYTQINYTPNGFCEELVKECFPYKNFTFPSFWDKYNREDIKLMINKRIIENNQTINGKLKARIDEKSGSVSIVCLKEIKFGEILTSFSIDDTLTSNQLNFNLFNDDFIAAKNHKNKLPSITLDEKEENYENFINLIINLLAHLHNFEHSKIKDYLLLLPKNFDNYLPFTFTEFELHKFLKGDELIDKLGLIRHFIFESYKKFKHTINTFWPKEAIIDLFHSENIPYQDFVYCSIIFLTQYYDSVFMTVFQNNLKVYNEETFLESNSFYIPKADLDDNIEKHEKSKGELVRIKDIDKLVFRTTRDYKENEIIEINTIRNGHAERIIAGQYDYSNYTYYEKECFDIVYFGNETADTYRHPATGCLSIALVYHFYVLGNYMNLIGREYSTCNKLLQENNFERNFTYNKERDIFIDEHCSHPEWKTDIFDFIKLQIDERFDTFHYNIKKIDEYIEYRENKKLDYERAKFLKEYLKMRLKLTKDFYSEFKKFRKMAKEKHEYEIRYKPDL